MNPHQATPAGTGGPRAGWPHPTPPARAIDPPGPAWRQEYGFWRRSLTVALVGALIVALLSLSVPVGGHDWPSVARVVQSLVRTDTGCTGFVIAPRFVVTAGHCTNSPTLRVNDHPALVALSDEPNDLVVLSVEARLLQPALKVARRAPRVGEAVALVGYDNRGVLPYILFAVVGMTESLPAPGDLPGRNFLVYQTHPMAGHSGSPVVNRKLEVVSVHQMSGRGDTPTHGVALGSTHAALTALVRRLTPTRP